MNKLFGTILVASLWASFSVEAQTPGYLCQLSISSPSGLSSLCNAVHIGEGQLVSAGHCFPEGQKTVTQGIILATCAQEEFMEFTKLKITSDPKSVFKEDFSLLEFSPMIKGDFVRPTAYPSMYFVSNQLRDEVQCEILALRGNYPSTKLKRIKVDKSMDMKVIDNSSGPAQIIMKSKTGGALAEGFNVKEGDSGGALICRYSKMAREELVGIIANYGTDRGSREIIQNSFSPVFGPQAKGMLDNKK